MLNTSETVKDLETLEGRRLLHDFFHDRRVRNALEIKTLMECWRLARKGTELQFRDGRRVRFETNLGLRLGTRVFLEEIVSSYYYNSIQGLVYAGAMVVLITAALYLAGYSIWFALAGLSLEALLLLLLAIVTAFSGNDDGQASPAGHMLAENPLASIHGPINEMTNAVADLFRLISQTDIRQDVLLTRLTENIGKQSAENTRRLIEKLEENNAVLREALTAVQAQVETLQEQQDIIFRMTGQTRVEEEQQREGDA
ncbi:MAG: hypothetical protein RRA94_11195 [Bacteroidota bacterium]|nr:hypothetical protein [Bacteroidota bacterium]